ncbi:ATP-binding protein [Cereibacter sphaeroides]|jgi:hypothetical protein|uniref:ATP-binding protein n=1 Tax=Cereibacter sphaeroides TaxID=1063 RepID=UPI0000663E97|nr:hypothetical protein Rsph17029_0668 [Cereibacter sphaeroides ATCC 17029]
MIRFVPVSQISEPLSVTLGLSGSSGTGKTYSAMRVARGMAEGAAGQKGAPFLYVDTENRRALHYRREFPEMVHADFTALDEETGDMVGFGPDRWISVLDEAERQGATALILDSFSHAWEGIDGVLDRQAKALDRLVAAAAARANGREVNPDSFNQLSWAEVKPPYRRLIDRIVRAKLNLIICTRAKPVLQKGYGANAKNARKTKTRRDDVPWDIAGDGDLIFEMTAMMMLDPSAPGCPVYQIKCADQFKMLFDPKRPMTEDTGRQMGEWARNQGNAADQKKLLDEARDVARRGTDALRSWWKANPDNRPVANTILTELQDLAQKADHAATADDSDPFAGAADSDGLTPQQRAEMEAAEKAFREQQEKEAQA